MEGWHGVDFAKPVTRTRETIEIIRRDHRGRAARPTTARCTRCRCPAGRARPSAARRRRSTCRSTSPSLGPANLRLTGCARRRLDRQLVLLRDRRRLLRPDRRRRRAVRPDAGRHRPHRGRELRDHRRRRGGRPPPRRGLRVHVRGDGLGDAPTSTTRRSSARASATTWREVQRLWLAGDRDAARRARAHRDRPAHQPHRPRRDDPRPPPPVPRLRRDHAPGEPDGHDARRAGGGAWRCWTWRARW